MQESNLLESIGGSCTDAQDGTGPYGYATCSEEAERTCFRPFQADDIPGVCVDTAVLGEFADGEKPLNLPFFISLMSAIEMGHTDMRINEVITVLTNPLGGQGDGTRRLREEKRNGGLGGSFQDILKQFAKENDEEIRKNSEAHGIPGDISGRMFQEFIDLAGGPAMEGIEDQLKEKLSELLQDPGASSFLSKFLEEAFSGENRGEIISKITGALVDMARDKDSGEINTEKLKSIKNHVNAFSADPSKIHRALNFQNISESFECDSEDPNFLETLIRGFIEPSVCVVLTAISTALELAEDTIIDDFYELLWGESGLVPTLLEPLLEIFRLGAGLFLYGNDFIERGDGDLQLPSEQRILKISEVSPDGDVYLTGACNVNFEAELAFYKLAKPWVLGALQGLGEAVGQWINAPIELIRWLLKMWFKLFEHMSDVCKTLDVAGALTTATWEQTRYILQETACRHVEEFQRGHGCDGIDNDCDFLRDECDEDRFPPEIESLRARSECLPEFFDDPSQAEACIKSKTSAVDDCREDVGTSVTSEFTDEAECTLAVTLTAVAQGCESEVDDSSYYTSTEVYEGLKIDKVSPRGNAQTIMTGNPTNFVSVS